MQKKQGIQSQNWEIHSLKSLMRSYSEILQQKDAV